MFYVNCLCNIRSQFNNTDLVRFKIVDIQNGHTLYGGQLKRQSTGEFGRRED